MTARLIASNLFILLRISWVILLVFRFLIILASWIETLLAFDRFLNKGLSWINSRYRKLLINVVNRYSDHVAHSYRHSSLNILCISYLNNGS